MSNRFLTFRVWKKGMATVLFVIAITFITIIDASAALSEKRIIVGAAEEVRIMEVDAVIKAKLDTGAKTSSINSRIIEQTDDYVVFEIISRDRETGNVKFKKKIERTVRIKRKKSIEGDADESDYETIRRPVVRMTFCIAGQLIEDEVNLSNRSHFKYDLLIGRNMLQKGQLIVDASKSFTANSNCVVEE